MKILTRLQADLNLYWVLMSEGIFSGILTHIHSHHTWNIMITVFTLSIQGPVVQSVVSLTSSLRVISLTVLADSIYNILIFFAEKM